MESLLVSWVQKFHKEDTFTHPWRVYWHQESRIFICKVRLLIREEFAGNRSPELSYGRCVYSTMESLLVSGVQEFHIEDAFTHPWRVYWYQESRSFIWKMCLLIRGEFTGTRSPGVSYERCIYSSVECLLVSGVQKFHKKDAFTHPRKVYWYQESISFFWKMTLHIHGEFTGKRSPWVSYGRCVYSSLERLLISGVQKFQFTHSWRVYWYHEFRSFIRKMCLLIHGEFTDITSSEVS